MARTKKAREQDRAAIDRVTGALDDLKNHALVLRDMVKQTPMADLRPTDVSLLCDRVLNLVEGLTPKYERVECETGSVVMSGAAFVAALTGQMAQMLEEHDAQNYLTLAVGKGNLTPENAAYELIVQRIGPGTERPAQKATRLENILRALREELASVGPAVMLAEIDEALAPRPGA